MREGSWNYLLNGYPLNPVSAKKGFWNGIVILFKVLKNSCSNGLFFRGLPNSSQLTSYLYRFHQSLLKTSFAINTDVYAIIVRHLWLMPAWKIVRSCYRGPCSDWNLGMLVAIYYCHSMLNYSISGGAIVALWYNLEKVGFL